MKIEVHPRFYKSLKKIDKKEIVSILKAIKKLSISFGGLNIKKLVNFKPKYRLRVGNYRILFEMDLDMISVYDVKHRKDVYK